MRFALFVTITIAIIYQTEARCHRKNPYGPPSPVTCAKLPHEVFINGGSPCQTTCKTLGRICNIKTFAPVRDCYCIKRYARNSFGRCIRIRSKECQSIFKRANTTPPKPSPATCSHLVNEVFVSVGLPCQRTCQGLYDKCTVQKRIPVNGCFCKKRFARNRFGRCIRIASSQCQRIFRESNRRQRPSPAACARRPNEKYIDGGSPCQRTCKRLNAPCNIRPIAPVKACYCIDGYARDRYGRCIPINSPKCHNLRKASHPPPHAAVPEESK